MPIPPPSNPLIDLMYQHNTEDVGDTISKEEFEILRKEQETRLLGTMMVQSIFLGLAIMLYSTWEWSQFSEPYYSALFYAVFAYSIQGSMYYTHRVYFEDSSNHRKKMRRMRKKQQQQLSDLKYKIESDQLASLLKRQMTEYMLNMDNSLADGYINSQEQALLQAQANDMADIAQQATSQHIDINHQTLEQLAQQLGIDRFRVGPVPLSPKLTVTQPPVGHLDLTPSGTQQAKEAELQENLA